MPRLSLTVNGAFAGGRLGLGMGRSPACLDGLSLTHVCWGLIKSTLRREPASVNVRSPSVAYTSAKQCGPLNWWRQLGKPMRFCPALVQLRTWPAQIVAAGLMGPEHPSAKAGEILGLQRMHPFSTDRGRSHRYAGALRSSTAEGGRFNLRPPPDFPNFVR